MLHLKPCEVKTKGVDMLMGSCVERFETYETVMTSIDNKYQMDVKLTKVHKDKLLAIDNPNYEAIIARYSHLSDVKISDDDKKASLPVHVVLSGESTPGSRQRRSLTSERTANRSQNILNWAGLLCPQGKSLIEVQCY